MRIPTVMIKTTNRIPLPTCLGLEVMWLTLERKGFVASLAFSRSMENTIFPWKSRSTFHYLLSDRSSEFLRDLKVVVVRPGQHWEKDDRGYPTYLLRQNMTPLARVWAEFLQDSLFPSSHKSEVRAMVLIAIYCIIRGHPMDVAMIISEKIYSHYNVGKEKPRPIFPHLITALIHDVREKARRPAFPVQQRLLVSPMLSKGRVNQLFQDWMSRMPQEEEEEEDPTEPAEEEEEEEEINEVVNEVVTPPHADPSPAWMEAAFGRMFLRQDRLHRDLDLHWRGGSTSDPGYQGPMDFNTLEHGMIDLSFMHDAGVHPDHGDGRGDHGPME
ncbi:uncharacterized protein LOC130721895 [Lotus japonicus]|uniref:uncharacterized protein LOC130721895 n=1 Tax=Lotus japonicus TaxID=34305 RepID=UPI002584C073|nr:uncharacterized protein LOC130721895 [Lotus japonicus]